MSRSGYSDDGGDWATIRWRGQVASATRGRRGQVMLRDLLDALDAMPVKRLIKNDLQADGEVCAIGALGLKRGLDMTEIDPEVPEEVAEAFDIARPLACEIVYENDEATWDDETPEERWVRMRKWVAAQIRTDVAA